ncbi:uncharacterized protein Z520_06438 [Fonsecaea multimorphosa CBS 102226]|uniref:FAD/NAD(P)-binding domain-containing protein n=1 Tax=Fonsecaea multimorphosa CBS 102226 TaxID=1442371 RepID=A0A0D2H717_9EURO|nr:uncharacterized protein Z520_06438 [Fonsecaea multimorphosa CBS 102226]KIX97660.1 hypothetical protein Z520_06438 [Fonsecaea multimorphosa CBS 102226]
MAIKYPNVVTNVLPKLPGSLPLGNVPEDVNALLVATTCLKHLAGLRAEHLTPDALWRDMLALTGSLRTIFSAKAVEEAWENTTTSRKARDFALVADSARVVQLDPQTSWVEARFTFNNYGTPATSCSGFISLVHDKESGWRIWVLRTILEQLSGHGNVDKAPQSRICGIDGSNCVSHNDFDCLIVGGGQSGLSTAGRLQALGVNYLVVEKHQNVGDSWMTRYDAVKHIYSLHTTVHLPFERTFDETYPLYLTKFDLARGYQQWVSKYGINIWLSTKMHSGSWDAAKSKWRIKLLRNGTEVEITASHIIFAVGAGGQVPSMPRYPGLENYRGHVVHSSEYTSAAAWAGRRGIVVGTANTAHDMAEDMLAHNLSVTMVQRSRTFVFPAEYFKFIQDRLYNETFDIDLADRMQFSNPLSVARQIAQRTLHPLAAAEPERFDALERVGFKVERFGDMHHHLNERQGGHYVDVGASAKIANGLIKIKSDALPTRYTEDGLQFSDGTEIQADVIVYATGFVGNIRQTVYETLGDDVATQVEDFWGLNHEGELLGAFKPSGHPRLWYIGGGCGHSRHYSRFVALQVKASVLGTPLPIYKDNSC